MLPTKGDFMSEPSLFTRIINGDIPAEKIFEDEHCIIIKDINPKAKTHLLVIPKNPIPRLVDAQPEHQQLLGHLLLVAAKVARQLGVGEAFRLVVNNGEGAGQTIFHLHLHILSDERLDEANIAQL